MHLILETLASSYPPQSPPVISFLSLDAEALPEISESFDVTAVPFLVLQRDGKVLESISGSEASKVRDAVERHAGKGGNTGKLGLPPALEATPPEKGEETGQRTGQQAEQAKNLSSYAPGSGDAATAPEMSSTQDQKEELDQRLGELVKVAPVMLFMKGTPSIPQCGFSRQLVSLLREKGVRYGFFKSVHSKLCEIPYIQALTFYSILADEEVRQGLKAWVSRIAMLLWYEADTWVVRLANISTAVSQRGARWRSRHSKCIESLYIAYTKMNQVKEELDNNPDFFSEFQAAPKGQGGMSATEAPRAPIST